jgi:hypothetical protein
MAFRSWIRLTSLLVVGAQTSFPSCFSNTVSEPHILEAFALLDVSRGGSLTRSEIAGVTFLGVDLSLTFAAADHNSNDDVDLPEFLGAACSLHHRHGRFSTLPMQIADAPQPTPAPAPASLALRGSEDEEADKAAAIRKLEVALNTRATREGVEVQTSVSRSLEVKAVWNPTGRCEKYIMLSCANRPCWPSRNATCDEEWKDCVCGPQMCSDLNGVCVPCDVEKHGDDYCNATMKDMWQTLCNGKGHHKDEACDNMDPTMTDK